MRITRREFLKYCTASAAALGLQAGVLGKLEKALADNGGPNVIWLCCANCTGCTVSLANLINNSGPTDVADLLINYLNLTYHPVLMGAAGDLAVNRLNQTKNGPFILVVEGGVPTAFDGHTCMLWTENGQEITAKSAVTSLASQAAHVICVGTCSSFGGIPGGDPNPTGIQSVKELTGKTTINIPGCPTHPDWIVWTVANLLAGVVPSLDNQGRPAQLFGGRESNIVHKSCPRRERDEADDFGEHGKCLEELGCKGEKAYGDCPGRQWNNATNWCIGADTICIACTERGFPDSFSPMYEDRRYAGCSGFCVTKAEWQKK